MATSSRSKSSNADVANAYHLYMRLLGYVRRYWLAIMLGGLGSMCYSGVDAWFIKFLQPLLDKGLVEKKHSFLTMAPFLVMGVFVLRGVASFISNFFITSASRSVILSLRQDLFAHLQKLPASYYDHTTTGQVLSVLLYSVDQVSSASADVLTSAVQAIFLLIGLTIVMFSVSWKLTLLFFILVPLVAVMMRIASVRIRRLSLSIQDSIAAISHVAEENIEGYKVVRSFEGQQREIDKFNKATRINRQREMKVVVSRTVSAAGVQCVMALALSLTLYIATLDISDSILSPGGFVVMVGAMLMMLKPMKDLAFVQNKLYRGLAGAQCVFALMDEKVEEDTGTISLARAKGEVEFRHVEFTYKEGKQVLHDINIKVEPGKTIALVGRSGSGKSTILSLLTRFYDTYSGSILLDGHSIKEYKLADLRRQFALVSQNVTLFHDTIANNIAYSRTGQVNEAEIIAAAKAAHAMEFIERLPNGFQSLVGENGVLLSGGQRQRIAIARAILKDAPILILDEATSALDTESERYIQAALTELRKSRTTFIIAHRLSTVENADQIIVMDAGCIVEVGTHQELLALNGYHARLYRMQGT